MYDDIPQLVLVFSYGVAGLENDCKDKTENTMDTHDLHKQDCKIIEHTTEKKHDKNTDDTHDLHNNYCNNININIKNIVNTDSHVHHPENEHLLHTHSHTHHTDHEHPAYSHHANIFNRFLARFLEMLQPLRHILDLINNLTGMSG